MSEYLYAGIPLLEVAGYDFYQMRYVKGRKRDKWGNLVRDNDLPEGVEVDDEGMRVVSKSVPFAKMFREAARYQGYTKEQAEEKWEQWKEKNPKFGKFNYDVN